MRKFQLPHTYVIICCVILLAAIGTYLIPAGVYDRIESPVTGKMVVDPASYHFVEKSPISPFNLFKAVPQGMTAAAGIIFFIFIIGGAFGVIQATGMIEAGIGRAIKPLQGKEKLLIPCCMFLFSLGGAMWGMAEDTLVWVPIGIALARALGFDALVGTSMITIGAAAGFSAGWLNPFTVGIAQGIAELPTFSGIGLRLICWITFLVLAAAYIYRYAVRVKADPTKSYVYDLELLQKDQVISFDNVAEFSKRHMSVLVIFICGIGSIVYGVFKLEWYINEIATVFLAVAVFSGLAGGLNVNKISEHFIAGAQALTFGALIVGFARAILVVLQEGQIVDSIVYYLATWISFLPGVVAGIGMYAVQVVLNFFIPSASGLAMTTMPIMIPLSDILGITRQSAVLAYQFGDGITNSIIPTSAVLMSYLAISKIPYDKWFKFVMPVMLMWLGAGCIFLTYAILTNYGPF